MNLAAAALVGAGCAALAAAPALAHPDHDLAFFVPGAGVVEGNDIYVILVKYIRSEGCLLDFSDHAATTAKARAAVGRALGLGQDDLDAAMPVLDIAIGQVFDVMMNDGVITVNREARSATLAGCDPG